MCTVKSPIVGGIVQLVEWLLPVKSAIVGVLYSELQETAGYWYQGADRHK